MAPARILLTTARAAVARRAFSAAPARFDAATASIGATPLPVVRKPVGALRGGLFGFFLGSTLAGAGIYTYALQDYKASNDLLTEDIYALQNAVDRLTKYVSLLEEKMDAIERKKKK